MSFFMESRLWHAITCDVGYAGFHLKQHTSPFQTHMTTCMLDTPGVPPEIYMVTIWNFTESSHKQNKDGRCKVSAEWLLTVSKLPLCMSSMGGRKRSARVLSFLSTVPPLRSSCSWRTKKRTFMVIIGSKDTVKKGWDREKLGRFLS